MNQSSINNLITCLAQSVKSGILRKMMQVACSLPGIANGFVLSPDKPRRDIKRYDKYLIFRVAAQAAQVAIAVLHVLYDIKRQRQIEGFLFAQKILQDKLNSGVFYPAAEFDGLGRYIVAGETYAFVFDGSGEC